MARRQSSFDLGDLIIYGLLAWLAYHSILWLNRFLGLKKEGFQSPGSEPGFCMVSAAVENCRCDDFHPCKNGFTCQKGLCRVPAMPQL